MDPKLLFDVPSTPAAMAEALAVAGRGIAEHPGLSDAWMQWALVNMAARNVDVAQEALERAAALGHDGDQVRYRRAVLAFLHGELGGAIWEDHDLRIPFNKAISREYVDLPKPRWNGESLEGKTLLVLPEQGIGDTIQYARFLPMIRERVGKLLVEVPAHLRRFLRPLLREEEISTEFRQDIDPSRYDYHLWMMSLPRLVEGMGRERVRSAVPYLQRPDSRRAPWREKLAALEGLKVGVVWNGNPNSGNDANRSFPGILYRRLAEVPGVKLIGMQFREGRYPLPLEERGFLAMDASREVGPWEDLGAAAAAVDVFVTVDTSAGHYLGACAHPVWLLLDYQADVRWGLEGETTPWYPAHRLFRQRAIGDWEEVLERVARELEAEVARWRIAPERPAVVEANREEESKEFRPIIQTAGFNAVIRGRHGYFVYNRGDRVVGKSLETYGEYLESTASLLQRLVAPKSIVIDVGAHIGTLTIPMARAAGPTGRVVAFEPISAHFTSLCANVALNSLLNVECYPFVVGPEPGERPIAGIQYDRQYDFAHLDIRRFTEGALVRVVTLDDFFKGETLQLLKINVNGMERGVLHGARKTIASQRPFLYIANPQRETSPALIEQLWAMDYELYWHLSPLFGSDNFAGNTVNVFGDAAKVFLLGIPRPLTVQSPLPKVMDAREYGPVRAS